MNRSLARCLVGCLILVAVAVDARADHLKLVFACTADNDLYRTLNSAETPYPRYSSAAEAVRAAPEGAGVLVLADRYPDQTTDVPPAVFDLAEKKRLRLYLEYPSSAANLKLGTPREAKSERAVVVSDAFGPKLPRMSIAMIHNCRFLPAKAERVHLVAARVAGFDTAVFGLPKETWPLLVEDPHGRFLVATTKLSHFITGRYAPADAWQPIWKMVLGWLSPGDVVPELKWTAAVRPTFARLEPLPADAAAQAVRRGADWYQRAGLLVHPSWIIRPVESAGWCELGGSLVEPLHKDTLACSNGVWGGPVGDGRQGILEGHVSTIMADGRQPRRLLLRADCNCESAMGLAMRGLVDNHAQSRAVAANILDFVYFTSPLQQGPRNDPRSPSYGLLGWFSLPQGAGSYCGDNNAKAMLATMSAAGALGSDRWDEPLLRALLGNFRTAGQLGFRNWLNEDNLRRNGWQSFAARRFVNPQPHYESWLWACYLWLYDKTKFEPLLVRARTGIRLMMQAYPDRWQWTNNQVQIERARMILPLAWLVRVEDRPEHRAWLKRIAGDLLAYQDACGAIRELVTKGAASNAEYGTGETSLLQRNGDPVADMLYVSNFALAGLNEAATATGDPSLDRAADKLAQFLVRIQTRSEAHPDLDGAWYRCFDFRRWDYWASNADSGWGAWCTETGWTQGWILAGLASRQSKTSLWELTAKSRIATHFDKYRRLMIPDDAMAQAAAAGVFKHLAIGKRVSLLAPADPRHPGDGPQGLTDGLMNDAETGNYSWLGFEGADCVATVDLDRPTTIRKLGIHLCQLADGSVFLPRSVEFSVSDDGQTFRTVATVKQDIPRDSKGPLLKTLWSEVPAVTARFVKVRAVNVGTVPAWHPYHGGKAWLFVDEIIVE
jgi:hypothetical protein